MTTQRSDFAIGIPWRPGNDHREASHRHVIAELRRMFPDTPVINADSGHPRFNRAASRNLAVHALGDFRAILLCDADTIPEREPVLEAIAQADDGALHFPFTTYNYLSRKTTTARLTGQHKEPHPDRALFPLSALPKTDTRLTEAEQITEGLLDTSYANSMGGAIVVTPRTWWAAGGMDERFTAWGYEDIALPLAATVLGNGVARHEGAVHHLWHPVDNNPHSPAQRAGYRLCERYQEAQTFSQMRMLVNEHIKLRDAPY